MHGDFSRWTDDAEKHYTGVLEQQGRVRVDADFNEYVAIQQRLRQITTSDVLGLSGAPLEGGGFEISVSVDQEGATPRPSLRISQGRIYVDGILCHLEKDTDYDDQDDYPLPDEAKLAFPEETLEFTAQVYLDVWQRQVTANEDPNLRDAALGGPDTTTRLQTVCQVKIKKNVTGEAALCEGPLSVDKPSGQLNTHVEEPSTPENPCIVAPGGGYRGLENRLYRVEIHKRGDLSGEDRATFTWSRDNGSVVYRIAAFKEAKNRVEVGELGRDRLLALRSDDWVEVLGEETELRGQSGTLAQIKEIDEARRLITFKEGTDVSAHKDERNPRLRRWDGVGKNGQGIGVSEDKIELEDGIKVSFSGETFRTGDYWFFAARTATREVELLEERPPQGIRHHYAKLALVIWRRADQGWQVEEVRDCRPLFPPLTALTQILYAGGDGQEALPGERLCQPLQVRLVNGNRPVEGEGVRFSLITPGEGQLRTPGEVGSTVTAMTDDQGLARCEWTLGSNPENRCQQVEAVLLNHDGNPAPSPIRFNASLSIAAQVHYDTSGCERLREVEANTVQQAIDQICKELTEPGIKVRKITLGNGDELRNDTEINMEAFREGIILTCDHPIDSQSVKRPTCSVTLEVPYRDSNDRLTSAAFTAITLAGVQKADGPRILWQLTDRAAAWLTKEIPAYQEILETERLLVRLTVKGNFIWAQDKPGFYLDGETYGIPAEDGSIGLDMKQGSGNGRRGGDFEMWFWLTSPAPRQPDIEVTPTGAIDFGEVRIGEVDGPRTNSRTVVVANRGEGPLEVTSIRTTQQFFTAEPTSFQVSPGTRQEVRMIYAPNQGGSHSAELQIRSNDPDESMVTRRLQGRAEFIIG